ncbi:Uncharacterised protein [Bordetella pertussis]|nr:Uncharacterised protein [Bordetella pertussis]CFP68018.1 Uncharacterised protein [Bordetella pertussis]CFT92917.1 Uncharacterised protein [Bordetella pertussis]CFW01965.1 Uncharacterised protein [Bordetella pertussis]
MLKPWRSRTAASSSASSSWAIEVPVGLLGEAISTPWVASFQWSRTSCAESWKRLAAVLGIRRGCPPAASTKLLLAGYEGSGIRTCAPGLTSAAQASASAPEAPAVTMMRAGSTRAPNSLS